MNIAMLLLIITLTILLPSPLVRCSFLQGKKIFIWNLVILILSLSLLGDKIGCSEEGKVIQFAFLEQDPCIMCQCRNGTVDCYKNHCETQNIMQHSESAPKPVGMSSSQCHHSGRSFQVSVEQIWFVCLFCLLNMAVSF